jgi:protein-tyrosine phosphatase
MPEGCRFVRTVLFVCTGNTCRSPLAEALTRVEAERRDIDVNVSSAGIYATDGTPASPQSVDAAARRGADLTQHRSQRLELAALADADLVLTMTPGQLGALRTELGRELNVALLTDLLPADHDRHGDPVSDPFGGSEEDYEEVARLLGECVGYVLDRLAEFE